MVFLVVGVHVDQFYKKIGIGTRGTEIKFGHNLAPQRDVFRQHVCFEHQYIGAGSRKALIFRHVVEGRKTRHLIEILSVGYRLHRVADIFGIGARDGRFVEAQFAVFMEIQRLLFGLRRGPFIKFPPFIATRVEEVGFGQAGFTVARAFQEVVEEFGFDIFLVKGSDAIAKVNVVVQCVSRFAAPASMPERPHHQRIVGIGVILFDGFVGVQRPVQILGVEPAADGHVGRGDAFEVRQDVALLPERVVVGVLHRFLPEEIVLVVLIEILQRSHIQVEGVAIGLCLNEFVGKPRIRHRFGVLNAKDRVGQVVALRERAIMVEIVEKEISDGRLR